MGKRIQVKRGDRYGRLAVIEEVEQQGYLRRFLCQCDCGATTIAVLKRLRQGDTKSCGCLAKETSARNGRNCGPLTHGHSYHPLYNTWRGMIDRCTRPSTRWYCNYGGRGIGVCDEWRDAATFIEWAKSHGWEEGLQIDRIDNDGDYCPENCRFVTRKANLRNARHNRLVTFRNVTQPLAAWVEATGINYITLRNRLNRGWTPEQALTLALRQGKKP